VRETEALGDYLPQCHFVDHKSRMIGPGLETGTPRWEIKDYLPKLWHSLRHGVKDYTKEILTVTKP
jgi:hypothetical protein